MTTANVPEDLGKSWSRPVEVVDLPPQVGVEDMQGGLASHDNTDVPTPILRLARTNTSKYQMIFNPDTRIDFQDKVFSADMLSYEDLSPAVLESFENAASDNISETRAQYDNAVDAVKGTSIAGAATGGILGCLVGIAVSDGRLHDKAIETVGVGSVGAAVGALVVSAILAIGAKRSEKEYLQKHTDALRAQSYLSKYLAEHRPADFLEVPEFNRH